MPDIQSVTGEAVEPKKVPEQKNEKPTKKQKAKIVVFTFAAGAMPKFGRRVQKEDGSFREIIRPVVDHVLRLDANDPDDKLVIERVRKNAVQLRATELKTLDALNDSKAPMSERIDSLLVQSPRSLIQMLDAQDRKAFANATMGQLVAKLLELE